MTLTPGSRFGSYEVLGHVASGGMGEVYRARDTRLSREAALKILPADVQLNAGRVARFEREARTLATLSHANIAILFGLEESGGLQALAMEFVEGQTLSDHLARPDRAAGLPLSEALSIASQIAVALEAAHDHGVVHRDLKPGNVMIRPDGTVKVLDFGLAMHEPDGVPASGSSTLTGMGAVVGTPAYMSPEQARAQRVDRRTDIWSFGCVLFELLSGRRAFDGPSASDVMVAVLEQNPDWSRLPPSTPAPLRRLLARCLTKDQRRRLRDMGDALLELEDAAGGGAAALPQTASRSGTPRVWRTVAIACGAGLIAALGWMVWNRPPAPPAAEPMRVALSFPDDAPLSVIGGLDVGQVAISPDGARIVYPTLRGLAVRSRDRLDVAFLDLPGENAHSPFFSPDGRWIGYTTATSTLRKVPVSGGASVLVTDTVNAAIGTWGADGIVFTDQRGLFRVGADGHARQVPLDLAAHEQPTLPEALPGGRVVLVTVIATRRLGSTRSSSPPAAGRRSSTAADTRGICRAAISRSASARRCERSHSTPTRWRCMARRSKS
jgi:hypothetical protein